MANDGLHNPLHKGRPFPAKVGGPLKDSHQMKTIQPSNLGESAEVGGAVQLGGVNEALFLRGVFWVLKIAT